MRSLLVVFLVVSAGCIPSGDSQKFGGSSSTTDASTMDLAIHADMLSVSGDATVTQDTGTPDTDVEDMTAPDMDVMTPDACPGLQRGRFMPRK
ncbi:MAG: hypothetical protein R3E66_11035 [bacterium]